MPDVNLADRLFLTADSTQTPQHVAALGIFSPPDGAPDDFVAALADRFRAARGFQARWKLSRFATGVDDAMARIRDSMSRGIPIAADGGEGAPAFLSTDLGVRFVQPVDVYSQSERAVKYGFLFVFLTFVAFFLFEVLRRMAIHPIQYALCGAALALLDRKSVV